MNLLTKEFLSNYPDVPEHMSELAQFTFYRTYSRWLEKEKRRETFKEAVARAVNYNIGISIKQFEENDFKPPIEGLKNEAELLFDNIFNLKQFLSGRTHWVGGAESKVAEKYPLSNFNCSGLEINKWSDIGEVFYLLLIGTGVGISCTKEMADNLLPIRRDYELIHSEYKPVLPEERLERTDVKNLENGYAKIYVGDSKEGWIEALQWFITFITDPQFESIKTIKISYNSIRPYGEKLKTFGGFASGYQSLKDMFIGIDKVFKDKLDTSLEPMEKEIVVQSNGEKYEEWESDKYYVRPIHILDICNLIGNNVIVGGVRRTAESFLCDEDDYEVIFAKYGINGIKEEDWVEHMELGTELYAEGILPNWWTDKEILNKRTLLTHRYMSNNSISFKKKPTKKYLELIFKLIRTNGEPGFLNIESAQKRRPNAKILNPCFEVLLDDKQVCNLTTVNVMGFVEENDEGEFTLKLYELIDAVRLSVRAGIRMTCLDLELPEWNKKHKRDRLIGSSLTGWKDAIDKLEIDKYEEEELMKMLKYRANEEAVNYSYILRIPAPLLSTTIKPEGTLSQVANGVSSGLHVSHAPYYIRRIRISASDPLVKVAVELGWDVKPENEQSIDNATTLVISFPCHSPASKTRAEQTLKEQFDTYFMFQENYTEHNSSNTITVKDDEWDKALDIIYDKWDDFIAVSFLSYDGGNYEQMPYEEITKEHYNMMKATMKPFSIDLLYELEKQETEKDVENMSDCESGVCPVF